MLCAMAGCTSIQHGWIIQHALRYGGCLNIQLICVWWASGLLGTSSVFLPESLSASHGSQRGQQLFWVVGFWSCALCILCTHLGLSHLPFGLSSRRHHSARNRCSNSSYCAPGRMLTDRSLDGCRDKGGAIS